VWQENLSGLSALVDMFNTPSSLSELELKMEQFGLLEAEEGDGLCCFFNFGLQVFSLKL